MAKPGYVWDGTQFVAITAPVGAFPNAVGVYGSSAPTSPKTGHIWFDTSVVPTSIKVYTGSSWTEVGGTQVTFDDSQNIIANQVFR